MLDGIFTSASTTPVSMVIKSTSKFVDATTTSKSLIFSLSAINTTTARTATWPDRDLTMVGEETTFSAIGTTSFSGATSTAIAGISSSVNHLLLMFECAAGTGGAQIYMQTYGADGVLDTATTDYFSMANVVASNTTQPTISVATSSSYIGLASNVGAGTGGVMANFASSNIQAATQTKFLEKSSFSNTSGVAMLIDAYCARLEADRITGVFIGISTGVMTGKMTLLGSR
jgi:hypothetical protein